MSYWKDTGKNTRALDSFGLSTSNTNGTGGGREFYELELGVVLDIILDDKHPLYTGAESVHTKIDVERWPVDLTDSPPSDGDFDYTWIGRALVRPIVSEKLTDKDQLIWAYPLDENISEYPLINETVIILHQDDKLFYTRKLNFRHWPHNNLNFGIEGATSGKENTVLFAKTPLIGKKESLTNYKGDSGFHGYAGQYYVANNKIRTVQRWEGDSLYQSRHGQTIHLIAYDKKRDNDVGDPKYKDYKDGGNPMILIRNRQRPLLKVGQTLSLHNSPNLATVVGTIYEKNVGGYLEENINHDGSSIHITCGLTISEWVTTCYKKMFGIGKGLGEEVSKFQGPTLFGFPELKGDQTIINTDRMILSARYEEMLQYSKKRFAILTDNEYTVDAHQQMIMSTHTKIVLNAPAIYLGEYNKTDEPCLLGQTTVNWLYELCNWLLEHTHWYLHSHVDAGKESPSQTQIPVQQQKLIALRDRLHKLMSRRVFLTGGGLAPGQNGASITDGTSPVQINVATGAGVPGRWKGKNYRLSAEEAKVAYNGALDSAFPADQVAAEESKAAAEVEAEKNQTPEAKAAAEAEKSVSDQAKVDAIKAMPADQQQRASKGGGCGGRSSSQQSVYAKPATTTSSSASPSVSGSRPTPDSGSYTDPGPVNPVEVKKWDNRIALLEKAGVKETDTLPPKDVDIDDWKTIVSGFK